MHWAPPVTPRAQLALFRACLDEVLPDADEMRVLDGLLEKLDWTAWEARSERRTGRPPLHPRLLAGLIVYGLLKGWRSSRELEEASRRRLDVIWFLEGRTVDHSTVCAFRRRFAESLETLFGQVARAASRGIAGAGRCAAVDGTRQRAHSDRHGARTAESLRRRLGELAERGAALLEELERRDCLEEGASLIEDGAQGAGALRAQLEALERQKAQLERALETAVQRDAQKQAHGGATGPAVRVPVNDPESSLLPNKEGGYAPNWTVTAAVDVASGVIVEARVVDGAEESAALVPAAQALRQIAGDEGQVALLADGNFPCGPVLQDLEEQGVALYSPQSPATHPAAAREDPRQAVAAEQIENLPLSGARGQKRFRAEAFLYRREEDCYYCPQGRPLPRVSSEARYNKDGRRVQRARYRCRHCQDCPLAPRCLGGEGRSRSLARDEYQPYRDRLAQRMSQPKAQQQYRRRAPLIEGVFGYIKHAMGIRRFYHCGRAAVQREWLWVCLAFNVGKMLRRSLAAGPGKRRGAAPGPESALHRAFFAPTGIRWLFAAAIGKPLAQVA